MIRHSLAALLLLCPAFLAAQQPSASPRLSGYLAAGAASIPRFQGSNRQQLIPFIGGRVQFGSRSITLDGVTARADLLGLSWLEAGPAVSFTFGRSAADRVEPTGTLGTIDNSWEIGGFIGTRISGVGVPGAEVRLRLQTLRGVADVHNGWITSARAGYSTPIGQRLLVQLDGEVRHVSKAYAITYFSVTPTAAASTGLAAFDAGAGIQQGGGTLNVIYALNRRWSLAGFASYDRLLGDAGGSPIVTVGGSRNQLSAGGGIAVSF